MRAEISRNAKTNRYIWRLYDETDESRGMLGSRGEYETEHECWRAFARCCSEVQNELERCNPN